MPKECVPELPTLPNIGSYYPNQTATVTFDTPSGPLIYTATGFLTVDMSYISGYGTSFPGLNELRLFDRTGPSFTHWLIADPSDVLYGPGLFWMAPFNDYKFPTTQPVTAGFEMDNFEPNYSDLPPPPNPADCVPLGRCAYNSVTFSTDVTAVPEPTSLLAVRMTKAGVVLRSYAFRIR